MTKPTPQPAALAQMVRSARNEAGISQQELADAAGLSKALIQAIESARSGRRRPPNIRSIARVLGLDEHDVLLLSGNHADKRASETLAGRPNVSERQFAEAVRQLPDHLRNAIVDLTTALASETSDDEGQKNKRAVA
jgi:transcriptional regulator with XRE-family HTH domain